MSSFVAHALEILRAKAGACARGSEESRIDFLANLFVVCTYLQETESSADMRDVIPIDSPKLSPSMTCLHLRGRSRFPFDGPHRSAAEREGRVDQDAWGSGAAQDGSDAWVLDRDNISTFPTAARHRRDDIDD